MKLKYPSSTESGDKDLNSAEQESTITAKPGFNFYEQKGLHSLTYKCGGLSLDWELITDLSSLQKTDVGHWDPPQVLGESTGILRRCWVSQLGSAAGTE